MEKETFTNTSNTTTSQPIKSSALKVQTVQAEDIFSQTHVQSQTSTQSTIQPATQTTTQTANQSSEDSDLTLEDVFINLRLISKINQGEKLLQTDKHINIDTSYFQLITRWIRKAGRTESIGFIQKVLTKAFEFSDILIKEKTDESAQKLLRLNIDLKNSLEGLTNLKITYMFDKLIQSEIDVMIDNIRSKLDINSKYLNFTAGLL